MVGWMAFQERSAAFQIPEVWLTKRLEDTTQPRSNYEVLVSTKVREPPVVRSSLKDILPPKTQNAATC